jgi:hypothetical protein
LPAINCHTSSLAPPQKKVRCLVSDTHAAHHMQFLLKVLVHFFATSAAPKFAISFGGATTVAWRSMACDQAGPKCNTEFSTTIVSTSVLPKLETNYPIRSKSLLILIFIMHLDITYINNLERREWL